MKRYRPLIKRVRPSERHRSHGPDGGRDWQHPNQFEVNRLNAITQRIKLARGVTEEQFQKELTEIQIGMGKAPIPLVEVEPPPLVDDTTFAWLCLHWCLKDLLAHRDWMQPQDIALLMYLYSHSSQYQHQEYITRPLPVILGDLNITKAALDDSIDFMEDHGLLWTYSTKPQEFRVYELVLRAGERYGYSTQG
jgi:hypothetical protein